MKDDFINHLFFYRIYKIGCSMTLHKKLVNKKIMKTKERIRKKI